MSTAEKRLLETATRMVDRLESDAQRASHSYEWRSISTRVKQTLRLISHLQVSEATAMRCRLHKIQELADKNTKTWG